MARQVVAEMKIGEVGDSHSILNHSVAIRESGAAVMHQLVESRLTQDEGILDSIGDCSLLAGVCGDRTIFRKNLWKGAIAILLTGSSINIADAEGAARVVSIISFGSV